MEKLQLGAAPECSENGRPRRSNATRMQEAWEESNAKRKRCARACAPTACLRTMLQIC